MGTLVPGDTKAGRPWTTYSGLPYRIYFVSNSDGNDSNDGQSHIANPTASGTSGVGGLPAGPFKTVWHALQDILWNFRFSDNNKAYWVLLKEGDIFQGPSGDSAVGDSFNAVGISGASPTDPMVISSYDPATFNPAVPQFCPGNATRPLVKVAHGSQGLFDGGGGGGGVGSNNLAIIGIELYSYQRDPNNPSFIDAGSITNGLALGNIHTDAWRLIENCKVSYFFQNYGVSDYSSTSGAGTSSTWIIRRNISHGATFDPALTTATRSQGCAGLTSFPAGSTSLIEDNHWDSNGWSDAVLGASRHEGDAIFNHNVYLGQTVTSPDQQQLPLLGSTTYRGNLSSRNAAGDKLQNGTTEDNLFLYNPILGLVPSSAPGITTKFTNNVCLEGIEYDYRTTFTGTGSGTSLTVVGSTPGQLWPAMQVTGTGVPGGTIIVSQTSGTPHGDGVYVTSAATTSSGDTLTAFGRVAANSWGVNTALGNASDFSFGRCDQSPFEFTTNIWAHSHAIDPADFGIWITACPGTSQVTHGGNIMLEWGTLGIQDDITGAIMGFGTIVGGSGGTGTVRTSYWPDFPTSLLYYTPITGGNRITKLNDGTPGTGINGTYANVPLTGGHGTGLVATITVGTSVDGLRNNVVTEIVLGAGDSGGTGYWTGDVVTSTAAGLPTSWSLTIPPYDCVISNVSVSNPSAGPSGGLGGGSHMYVSVQNGVVTAVEPYINLSGRADFGKNYTIGDTVTASSSDLGGGLTGFTVAVSDVGAGLVVNSSPNFIHNAPINDGDFGYPHPNRSVAEYAQTLGLGLTTRDQFLDYIIANQRKGNWNDALMASSVNDFIRAGFGSGLTPQVVYQPTSQCWT